MVWSNPCVTARFALYRQFTKKKKEKKTGKFCLHFGRFLHWRVRFRGASLYSISALLLSSIHLLHAINQSVSKCKFRSRCKQPLTDPLQTPFKPSPPHPSSHGCFFYSRSLTSSSISADITYKLWLSITNLLGNHRSNSEPWQQTITTIHFCLGPIFMGEQVHFSPDF